MKTRRELQLAAFAAAFSASAAGCAAPARANEGPWRKAVLVELFTSQGCSSCPAADAFVAELPNLGFGRDRVVPLTFHVDYWDNLGWPDPFASRAFTERQRNYAQRERLSAPIGSQSPSGVYTPQMVIDGSVHFSGRQRKLAVEQMRSAASVIPSFSIEGKATIEGGKALLNVQVRNAQGFVAGAAQEWRVWAALAQQRAQTSVRRGENSGETLTEAAVVRVMSQELQVVAKPMLITLEKPHDVEWNNVEFVVVMQSHTTGQVASVVSLNLSPHNP
jgi:hypothetical protein